MITIRRSEDRGKADQGWLKSRHTFSFSEYFDRSHMNFRSLRVINEDWVSPGEGFDMHPHQDMEIVTYMVEGALEHKDSMGNGSVIRPGEIQRMTAGTGVLHSEFNASLEQVAHLLQIWILPEKKDLQPGYEQKAFPEAERLNRLKLLASRDGREGSVTIHQDAAIYGGIIERGREVEHRLGKDRHAWIQVVGGRIEVGGVALGAGDGAAVSDESALTIRASEKSELLVFDLG